MEHQTAVKTNQAPQTEAAACAKADTNQLEALHRFRDLHQRIGNRAVGRLIQTKLKVSHPNDHLEIEADRVADQVMRMTDPERPNLTLAPPQIQRACGACLSGVRVCKDCGKDDERTFRKEASDSSALQPSQPETTSVADGAALPGSSAQFRDLTRPIYQVHGEGLPLPSAERAFFEPRFGQDFGGVRVHFGAEAASSARAIHARAYTAGRDIVFGAGEYLPASVEGRRLLAHELAHVVQQGHDAPTQIQRTVDNVEINCGDYQIHFVHDGTVTSYPLDHCDVTDGSYYAGVTLGEDTVDFDLGEVSPETLFDFHYSIEPGQPNPNEFFVGQDRVGIECTHIARAGVGLGDFHFTARQLTPGEFQDLTGRLASSIPEGVMIPLENIVAPAVAGASRGFSSPWSFVPRDTTGVLWTEGHTSIFAAPEGASPTIRGYRGHGGYYAGEYLPVVGRHFTLRLHEGVPGSFVSDVWFPFMPGEQHWVFAPRSHTEAESFATRLRGTEYGGEYTYSPPRSASDPILGDVRETEARFNTELRARGAAPMCTNNCITVPTAEIEAAIGGRPTTASGVDVMTGRGPEGTVDPHHAGRGRLMTEAMAEGPLPADASRIKITAGAGRSMFVIRGAGGIMLVYGVYQTEERIRAAVGTPELPTVITEEAGSWAGGIIGSALGGALAGAVVCAPTGPIDAICVVGGFAGGLLFGIAGAALGHVGGHELGESVVTPAVESVSETFGGWERGIYNLYGVPYY